MPRSVHVLCLLLVSISLPAEPGRLPVPLPIIVEEKSKSLRKLYRSEYSRKDAASKITLARTLLDAGRKERRDQDLRYVLLEESRQLAAKSGGVDCSLEAVGLLAQAFEVDELPLRAETLSKLSRAVRDPEAAWRVAYLGLKTAEDAALENDYRLASTALADARSSARKARDPWLLGQAGHLKSHLRKVQAAYEEIEEPLLAVARGSEDSEENLTVGQFLCFSQGDWKRGLPKLAKGSDATLRELASLELAVPESAEEQLRLADGWWKQAASAREHLADYMKARAVYWYEKALRKLEGVRERQIVQLLLPAAESLPYLPHLHPDFGMRFDGIKQHVVVNSFRYDGSHPLTVEAIVKAHRRPTDSETIVGNLEMSGFGLRWDQGSWEFWFHDKSKWRIARSTLLAVPHRRVHVAGVFDGKQLRVYVDGKPGRPFQVDGSHIPSRYPLFLGAEPGPLPGSTDAIFAGAIDEVRISRIARYTKSYKPCPRLVADPDTLLLFHFDEGDGTTIEGATRYGHRGVIRGAEWIRFR